MSMKHEPLRYAHDQGHTDICFSENGSKFVTCGADGDIRIWSIDESEDPVNNCVGEWSLSIAQKGDKIYVSTDSNDVRILSLEDGERAGVLDRSTAPINHIAIDKSSQLIALASEAKLIKLVDLDNSEKEVNSFEGLMGPCLSVSLSSKSKLLAASSGDTKLRVWDYESKVMLHEDVCFPKVNSFSNAKVLCRMDFEPTEGKHLAYPEKDTVVILQVSDWSNKNILKCSQVDSQYSIVQYSPCGKYILAASEKGDFVIWNTSNGEVSNVSKHEASLSICGLMWNPLGNGQIVYTDVEGQLGTMEWSVKSTTTKTSDAVINTKKVTTGDENGVLFNDEPFDDDDEDNENAFSVSKLKEQYLGDLDLESKDSVAGSSRANTPRPRTPEIPLQPPFMSSSTPEHLDPRYMCWNEVGVIRCYGNNADEGATKSIEVEFHDSTFHNSMMMQNYQEYTMGTLSRAVLLVANSSQIHVVPLVASSKEWMLKMEDMEEIVLVTASENLVCFAMSNYIIRVASVYGTQRAVISIPGPVVSMSAFKNLLMVAFHTSSVRKGDQCVNIRLIKFEGTSIECKDISSAMGPESTLQWMGFSDVGTPSMMDSLGMLSMYPHNTNTWIPFCDTTKHRKSPGDGFFVTTIFESNQTVGGIFCKGTVYPGFTPRPTMCEVPIEPPFSESLNDKTKMEMNLFTWSMLQIPDIDKKFKENAIKTFALACKNNLDERALELMEILLNPQIITLALKYATKLDKRRLAEKLTELLSKVSEETEDAAEKEAEKSVILPAKPAYRKLSLNMSKRTPKNKPERHIDVAATPDMFEATQRTEISTPQAEITNSTFNGSVTDSMIEEMETKEQHANPFLKKLKNQNVAKNSNPLSLTDKFAGVTYGNDLKENKDKNTETGEKRKLASSENEKPKEKQRKLDMFKFKKVS
ncbi:unnamed protein product [Psylliodes chrysocephalus]|uniref:WD repeat and HMG-box DNA-binding protein 1 n=1 Tax=Psylliodes chrysocephalus TaxID=3402493 RepID=A0A9P0G6H6_9CUCU|nr:unnamed protein product [Psylliodes chrysocephala]